MGNDRTKRRRLQITLAYVVQFILALFVVFLTGFLFGAVFVLKA